MPPLSVTLRLLAVVGLAASISQFLRGSISVLAPDLMREVGIPAETLGLLTGIFFFTHAAMQLPNGVFLDRYGPRAVYAVSLAVITAGSLLFAFADSPASLMGARFLMGMGASALVLGAFVLFARWYPAQRFPQMVAIVISISNIGTLSATTPLAAAAERFGWRAPFLFVAALGVVALVLAWMFVREAPRPADAPPRRKETLGRSLVSAFAGFGHRKIRLMVPLALVAYPAVMTVQALWGGAYLHDVHGLGLEARSYLLLGTAITAMAAPLFWSWLGTRIGARKTVAAGASTTIAFMAAFALLPDPGLVVAGALIVGIGITAGYGIMLPATARLFLPDSMTGRAMTAINIATIGGVSLWHALTGFLIGAFPLENGLIPEVAFRAMFAVLGVAALLGLWLYWRIGVLPEAPPDEDASPAVLPGV